MVSTRFVFLIGTLIALAGNADAAVTSCSGATGTYNTEDNSGGTACKCSTGYVATDGVTVTGDTTLDCVKCDAGYQMTTAGGAGADAANAVCTIAPANYYHAGKDTVITDTDALANEAALTPCPYGGTSSAGSAALTDCTPAAVSSPFEINANTVRCVANFYGTPTDTHNQQLLVATKGCTACPFAGTSSAGSTALTACTPAAVSSPFEINANTVRCVANFYGTPLDSSDAALGAPAKGCTACPFAGTSSAGSAALTDCTPAAVASPYEVNANTVRCLADFYGTPLDTNDAALLAPAKGCTGCPTDSESVAGTTTLAGCTVKAGKRITTKADSATDATNLVIADTQANYYSLAAVTSATEQDAATVTASETLCPYDGTAAGGSDALSDCTPKCAPAAGSALFLAATPAHAEHAGSSGTCTCGANTAGTATPTNGLVTGGCTLSGNCAVNEKVSNNKCVPCDDGTTKAVVVSVTGGDTTCDKTLCAENEYVSSNVCTACPTGYTNAAGDDASGSDTICGECAANFYVSSKGGDASTAGTCTACATGSTNAAGDDNTGNGVNTNGCGECAANYYVFLLGQGTDAGRCDKCEKAGYSIAAGGDNTAAGALTTCVPTLCAVNEYVSSNMCTTCAAGTTNAAGDDASGADTACVATKCAVNEYVSSKVCTKCAAGTTIAKDGDASGADTACVATKCAVDEYVSSNVCTDCPAGSTNAAGDDATGADTTCDIVSGASPLEVTLTSMISFMVLGFLALAM